MSNGTPKHRINESRDIHPLVAVWLTKNGYSYIHEYTMPDFGRVDFFATHSDGHTLLVEAKGEEYRKVITQLAGYGVQMPEAKKAVAIAQNRVTDKIRQIAQKYNILLIEVDFVAEEDESDGASQDQWNSLTIHNIMNTEKIMKRPEYVINLILSWHEERNSFPLLDLLVLYYACGQANPAFWSTEIIYAAQEFYLEAMQEIMMDVVSGMSRQRMLGAVKLFDKLLCDSEGLVSLPKLSGASLWEDLAKNE